MTARPGAMVGASGSHRAALPGMANAMALLARHEPSFARKYKHLDATDLMEVTTLFGLFDASACTTPIPALRSELTSAWDSGIHHD